MILNFFTYSLSNNSAELTPRQFAKSTFYTIHFGNDSKGFREKFTKAYPSQIKSATQKRLFVDEILDLLESRRQRRNETARIRRIRPSTSRSATRPDRILSHEEKLTQPQLKLWAIEKYFPYQYKYYIEHKKFDFGFKIKKVLLKNDMVYITATKDFSSFQSTRVDESIALKVFQTYVFFKEIPVNPSNEDLKNQEIESLKEIIYPLVPLMKKAKGKDKYIIKIHNMHYLSNNTVQNTGWSLSRTDFVRTQEGMKSHIDRTLDMFYADGRASAKQYLSRKFMSKITTYGVLFEKLVDIR